MGALSSLKILDFTTLLPGPYATLLMADLGADVLKITAPDRVDLVTEWGPKIPGTELSGPEAWLGRNKDTIFLNLKKPKAVEAVKKLILEYDIVIEQFRPGVMAKLGLGYEELKKVNPALIYCSLTGYGQTGPMALRAGHDINYLSRAGLMAASGRKEGGPALYGAQVADIAAGSYGSVIGILAAVVERDRTGKGQHIDISMEDGVVPLNTMDAASFLAGGKLPAREEEILNGGCHYDFYETSDGQFMSVGSLEPKFKADLLKGLGLPETAVKDDIKAAFRLGTRSHWEEVFAKLDACVEPVQSLAEASEDEHLAARGMWPEVPLEGGGTVRQMGCPVKLSESPAEYRHAGYKTGAQTGAILSALGYTEKDIDEMM